MKRSMAAVVQRPARAQSRYLLGQGILDHDGRDGSPFWTRLIAAGFDKPPYYVNIVLGAERGFQGAMPYTPDTLALMVKLLPASAVALPVQAKVLV